MRRPRCWGRTPGASSSSPCSRRLGHPGADTMRAQRLLFLGIALTLLAACAPSQNTDVRGSERSAAPAVSGPKRLIGAIRGNPHTVYQKLNPRSNIPGINALERLVTTGLTVPPQEGSER